MNAVARTSLSLGAAFLRHGFHAFVYMIFLILLLLRPVIRFLLLLGTPVCFFWALIMWGSSGTPHHLRIMWEFIGIGFATYALAWFYDTLLLRLSPTPLILY